MPNNYIYDYIVVRYGELTTKGKNRKDFINCLVHNIRQMLKDFKSLTYDKFYDGLFIHLNGEDYDAVKEKLQLVFGYAYFAGALRCDSDIKDIAEAALCIAKNSNAGTFKINARRNDKTFPMVSDAINREVAALILKETDLKVDVHNPDLMLVIIVRKGNSYVLDNKIEGLKGYPVGINHKALLMISGGIDSPVAGYMAMKRGMRIEAIHFASMPYTSKQALDKVISLSAELAIYQQEIILHIIPFTDLQLAVYKNADESYAITLLRRMMYRIADRIAKERHILTIVNGESVGQVASQTLESMNVISKVADTLILRPLCMEDKLDIINYSKKINTYETSILPYEDCCTIFSPKNPVTKPKEDKCLYYENKFDYETLINECILKDEVIKVTSSLKEKEDIF